jgi:hypothetical protein
MLPRQLPGSRRAEREHKPWGASAAGNHSQEPKTVLTVNAPARRGRRKRPSGALSMLSICACSGGGELPCTPSQGPERMKSGSHTPRAPRTRRCGWGFRIPSEANCNQRARLCVFTARGQSDDERTLGGGRARRHPHLSGVGQRCGTSSGVHDSVWGRRTHITVDWCGEYMFLLTSPEDLAVK